ncbi:MAG TPA: adenosylcobinamide-GDP ribazoletransferase [Streptosporangiaceae bacterium]|nr:adenosylcobinamide-GDP ribazoletransferase [Streptosporangiaceae bacterium]
MSAASGTGPLRLALSMFTVIPAGDSGDIGEADAGRAVLWLPAVGLVLAVAASLVMLPVQVGGHSPLRELLAAVLAVATVALLTGALHLDGLADTADGLGSRRPRDEALEIMRRPDIGPMGVAALVLMLLIQVSALAAISRAVTPDVPWAARVLALSLAVVTSRVAVVAATGAPAARAGGFGALVAGQTTARARTAVVASWLVAATAAGAALGGPAGAARDLAAVLTGLVAGVSLRRAAERRLGGMTGDVYGAIIEVTTATVLVVLAASA